jgi:hypothetical protein
MRITTLRMSLGGHGEGWCDCIVVGIGDLAYELIA